MLVSPEFTSRANAGLDFIDDEQDIIALCNLPQSCEKSGRSMVVPPLGLDRLNDHCCHRVVKFFNDPLDLNKATLLFSYILLHMLLEWVFKSWERRLRPIECGNVKLV